MSLKNAKEEALARDLARWRKYIREFLRDKYQLEPQPVKPQYAKQFAEICALTGEMWETRKHEVKATWFGDPVDPKRPDLEWTWYSFEKGKHYTWQQNLILMGVEKAVAGHAKPFISVVSGHGIGKSTTVSWIVLWFLYTHYMSQFAATAPTAYQMHDVLWKELSKWINKLAETSPDDSDFFRWTSEYVRVEVAPNEWFARARTSTKENTQSLAGVHADEGVGLAVDEASQVPNQVFNTIEGALTSGNVFLLMIGNGTEVTGYFFDSHNSNKAMFQCFCFNGEESPMVDRGYIKLKMRHGKESDEYRIRVMGKFPRGGNMNDKGYMQLIPIDKITVSVESEYQIPFIGRKILALDPAGEGKDKATWCLRNKFRAKIVGEQTTSSEQSMAEETIRLAILHGVWPEDIVVASFGTGADVGRRIALGTAQGVSAEDISEIVGYTVTADTTNALFRRYMTPRPWDIYTVMEGNTPEIEEKYNGQFFHRHMDEVTDPNGGAPDQSYDPTRAVEYTDIYVNIRALMYFRTRAWCFAGGVIVDADSRENSQFAYELSQIFSHRALHGNKINLEPKQDMKKRGVKSPNKADALALSMLRDLTETQKLTEAEIAQLAQQDKMSDDERFNAL